MRTPWIPNRLAIRARFRVKVKVMELRITDLRLL